MHAAPSRPPLDWLNIGLLTLVHVAAVGGLALYLPTHGLSLAAALTGIVLTGLTIFSISAGYHRLFSHRAYEAHPVLRLFLLIMGAGAFQNSALAWATDHRRHHNRTDSDDDPYDARRGLWYSHIGWVVRKDDKTSARPAVHDLEKDPLVLWQHRHYAWVGIGAGLVLPALIGLAFGDLAGGFVVGAAVRLLVCYHATFTINSLAHRLGSQPYSDKSSARDSLIVALLSMGEGYHNFHHTFPADYRNGVGRYQYDPTKWILHTFERIGLARGLKRTPVIAIDRALARMEEARLGTRPVPDAARADMDRLRTARQGAAARLGELMEQLAAARLAGDRAGRHLARQLTGDLKQARRHLHSIAMEWRRLVRALDRALPGGPVAVPVTIRQRY